LIDPVGLGLVVSEARPGANVTGILASIDSLPGKAIEILREMVPQATRIGVLVNIGNPQNPGQARDAAVAMANSAVKVVPVEVRSVNDLDAAFATLAREQVQAVLVLPDSLFAGERRRIATLAIAGRLPTMSSERYNVEEGALISYGVNRQESYHRAAPTSNRRGDSCADGRHGARTHGNTHRFGELILWLKNLLA
jgi:putative ABC transport system substrate-binding protein